MGTKTERLPMGFSGRSPLLDANWGKRNASGAPQNVVWTTVLGGPPSPLAAAPAPARVPLEAGGRRGWGRERATHGSPLAPPLTSPRREILLQTNAERRSCEADAHWNTVFLECPSAKAMKSTPTPSKYNASNDSLSSTVHLRLSRGEGNASGSYSTRSMPKIACNSSREAHRTPTLTEVCSP